ncbi:hypothetical protein ECANGB1_288 [Enterospora canceri]|uniref:Uncharacterized protein n=1 Tax=Enterospora canceri TaxID=1081671 RepID=A0A1Y1S4I1_9MICR|nr:hypothetical protein ECANGB1_288 [Enterospora canceri]
MIYKNLKFNDDPVQLTKYINKRLMTNDLLCFWNAPADTIDEKIHSALSHCPATTICVERSFSMLNKTLAHDRNFKSSNVVSYLKPRINK